MLSNAEVSNTAGASKVHADNLSFWKQQFASAPPPLDLPLDYRRSASTSSSFSKFYFVLPKALCAGLNKLDHPGPNQLSSVLLTAFSVLLYRYTNQAGMMISVIKSKPIANVNGAARLIRNEFTEMFLRVDLSDEPQFGGLLKRVHDTVCAIEEDKQITFKACIDTMVKAGVDVNSIFQIVFEFHALGDLGYRATTSTIPNEAKPDIWLSLEETLDGLTAYWRYNEALFEEATIKRLAGHFQNLLFAVVENPNQSICKLNLLSAQERLQILFEWNDTATKYPLEKCVHELFEQQVSLTPDAVAVEYLEVNEQHEISVIQSFTYQQLNRKANQVAYYLRDVGVGPGILVGVCVRRSFDMIVALLGVLKAGGAYVPLDTAYPGERLQFMLTDSGVSVLLTQTDILKELPLRCDHIVCIDGESETLGKYPDENLFVNVQPEDLIYVIYTSGSTGTPKGTMIVHRGVVNYLSWCIREYDVAGGSGAPVNSSIAFDATVTSVFAPLLTGKRIVLLPEKDEIEALSTVLLSNQDFSLVKITPAHLDMLQHLLQPGRLNHQVRAIVIGGESLNYRSIDTWRKYAKGTRLINEYGPTETVVGCCTYEVSDESSEEGDVPIGRPIANTRIYILDSYMQPVPIGVPGEIYIGGAGVALGYLNRPELTRERFVFDPFTNDASRRLYKTGDLGRYLPNGDIIFQGRMDHQVKIRGYRIELAEVEAALRKHPAVIQAIVVVKNDPPEKRLVTYLVTRDLALSGSDLRMFLGKILPRYMVPSAFVFMDELPLTPNGKVDRKSLPAPDDENTRSNNIYIAPHNKVERQLLEIYKKVLNVQKIGITEDFFELGGSSMKAADLFSRIEKATGKHLPLSTLIANPTIEKLALFIKGERKAFSSLVPIQTKGSKPPFFCVHGGWGHVLFYRHLSKHLGTDQPLYALQAKGLAANEEPFDNLVEMAAHYIREIRSVQPVGPYYLSGYCLGAIIAFEMASQLRDAGETIAFLASYNGIAPRIMRAPNPETTKKIKIPVVKTNRRHLRKFFKMVKIYLMVKRYHLLIKMRSLSYRFFFTVGRSLPQALRRWYIVDALARAQDGYDPEPYPGDLVIFRSPKIFKSPDLGWSPLIKGNIKTYDIPGDHADRTRIMYEPFVRFLAESVQKHLEEAKVTS